MKYNLDKLTAGAPLDDALAIFEAACDKPDTLWVTESWLRTRANKLRQLLSDPITDDEAEALLHAVLKRRPLDHILDQVIEWLGHAREMSWHDFVMHKSTLGAEFERLHQEQRLAKHLEWLKKLKARPRAACPRCGAKDDVVPILYGLPERPILASDGEYVLGGCMVGPDCEKWHCKKCLADFGRLFDG